METLKSLIQETFMTKDEILYLRSMLDDKMSKLKGDEFKKKLESERKNVECPKDWLTRAIEYFEQTCKEQEENRKEVIEDSDFLIECFTETIKTDQEPTCFFFIEDTKPNCCSNDCWYDNNRDRRDECEGNYYHINNKSPFCDVCINNMDNKWEINEILYTEAFFFIPEFKETLILTD